MNTAFNQFSRHFPPLPGEFLLRRDLRTQNISQDSQNDTHVHNTASLEIRVEDAHGQMPTCVRTLEKTGAASVTAYGVGWADPQAMTGSVDALQTVGERDRMVFKKRCEYRRNAAPRKKVAVGGVQNRVFAGQIASHAGCFLE